MATRALTKYGGDDIYFHEAYADLYSDLKAKAVCFTYEKDGNIFVFPFLKRVIDGYDGVYDLESPYGYAGPLSTSSDIDFLTSAWKAFYDNCRKQGIIAGFIRFHPLLKNHTLALKAGIEGVSRLQDVVLLNLNQSPDDIFAQYAPNTRTHIRQAQQKGVIVEKHTDSAALTIFQKLYHATLDQLQAKEYYYFDDTYFIKIANNLKNNFEVFLAKVNDVYMGGALVWVSPHYVHYHLSANLKEYRSYSAASLLRHEVINHHLNGKHSTILFGGGKTSSPDDSLLTFKKGFSKETTDFYIGKLIFDSDKYHLLCQAWEKSNPGACETYKNYFLKYRCGV